MCISLQFDEENACQSEKNKEYATYQRNIKVRCRFLKKSWQLGKTEESINLNKEQNKTLQDTQQSTRTIKQENKNLQGDKIEEILTDNRNMKYLKWRLYMLNTGTNNK